MNYKYTQENTLYSRAMLIKLAFFIAAGFGGLYWVLFLVIYPLNHLSGELLYMAAPYSLAGLGLWLVSINAYLSKHYFISVNCFVGLLVAGAMA